MGGFCLLSELHQEGSAPAACTVGYYYKSCLICNRCQAVAIFVVLCMVANINYKPHTSHSEFEQLTLATVYCTVYTEDCIVLVVCLANKEGRCDLKPGMERNEQPAVETNFHCGVL